MSILVKEDYSTMLLSTAFAKFLLLDDPRTFWSFLNISALLMTMEEYFAFSVSTIACDNDSPGLAIPMSNTYRFTFSHGPNCTYEPSLFYT